MKTIISNNILNIDLYHGTSTLFLESILLNGLGGINPINKWKVKELSFEIFKLSEEYLKNNELYKNNSLTFKQMAEQYNSGSLNFQHGDTYLSPSQQTAIRYAVNKEYGSELLTYTIKYLKELLKLDIPYIKNDLFRKYPEVFNLLDLRSSPILIKVKNVNITALLNENGQSPEINFIKLQDFLNKDFFEMASQQTNFRLKNTISKENLEIYLINMNIYNPINPEYNLYRLTPLKKHKADTNSKK